MTRTLFIFLLAAFLAVGCGGKDNRALADYVARQDRMCPMPADSTLMLISVAYNEDDAIAVIRYSVNETYIDIADMMRAMRQLRTAIAARLRSDNSEEFLQMLADRKAALRFDFGGISTGGAFSITFTPEQIRELAQQTKR